MRKTIAGLQEIGRVTLYGDTENIADKVGMVVFNIAGRPHGEVAHEIAKKAFYRCSPRRFLLAPLCVATAENSQP